MEYLFTEIIRKRKEALTICWFRDTGFFMPGSRITYSAGIDTDATGNNGGYRKIFIVHGRDGNVMHAGSSGKSGTVFWIKP